MVRFIYFVIISSFLVSCHTAKKTTTSAKTSKGNTLVKKVKGCKKYDGLFTIYRDSTDGTTYIEVQKDQLNKEFIYFSYIENGIVTNRLNKGRYNSSKMFTITKEYNKLLIQLPNTSYYFDPENAISKSAESNINAPIIISEEILGERGDTSYLIKAHSLFLDENFETIKPDYSPTYKGFKLGKLSASKSNILEVKNYPKNTDIRARYVYENTGRDAVGTTDLTDGRFISIVHHHTIVESPDNDFTPRRDDPRVGYFMTEVTDLTSASVTPYKDVIRRWHLVKKNPDAALSEPVEPIVWWMENTTPKELRPIIKEGVESWNLAFEKIGFKNAIVVKQQPDDATWDAGDIRYNVLRWTSSPNPPFGGYGPCFSHPRTGQILGADIMLEYIYVLGRAKRQPYYETDAFDGYHPEDCYAGLVMAEQASFANFAFESFDLSDIDKNEFLTQAIKRLVLHEVGHTLGLNHNMKGSTIHPVEDLKKMDVIEKHGLCNSVMEYPAINIPRNEQEKTYYYDFKPGHYDDWAIEYGYSVGLDDESSEEDRLTAILSKSGSKWLVFGNDADDMRSSGKAIDPMVNIYDLSNDPVKFGVERILFIDEVLMPKIMDKFQAEGESKEELKAVFSDYLNEKSRQLTIITRQIGGVYVNRVFVGDKNEGDAYTPVPKSKQKEAINALNTYAFSPKAFDFDENLLKNLQPQRRGFNFFSESEEPKIHEGIKAIHASLLDHLLHANVLNRLTNTSLYGNEYQVTAYLNDLTAGIFDADKNDKVNTIRQNLQVEYTKRLIDYLENPSALYNTKSGVLYQLKTIEKIAAIEASDLSTAAHRAHLSWLIKKALEVK